ncbi:carboxylating nicotinate-nucleotide diphosphorylase [Hyphomicrobium methylovorum]|uniref:carboxylating nicotinate-nucleotide diphosphorylase n=1 Tax=Hyphomicrobium methylovorum TaxID=84 RepID=UPI0015E7B983|nr:carboxylating nicotinate-nucleotide diphosphorylase [Hyphomicrobium methylovorum]MBA2127275.1 carboxylating nicotinate-nucleotide diphosphorylase [Hyphomicrobium methylovorum]
MTNKISRNLPVLPHGLVVAAVRAALDEDLGLAGDITTNATIPADAHAKAVIAARKPGVVSGLDVAEIAFSEFDSSIRFARAINDGDSVTAGTVVARIEGPARAVLSAERVALNFLGRMSGIATLTRRYVDAVAGTGARIVDTRKTTPGLRAFEKYAVRCGGGFNHRVGLFDAVLIKDNHIVAAGGIAPAIRAAKAAVGHMTKIEIEVDTLDQLELVLREPVDCVLLDNMNPATLAKAVQLVSGRCLTEASGGVTLETVNAIAKSGVDLISVGALTHSAPVFDFGLDFLAATAGSSTEC